MRGVRAACRLGYSEAASQWLGWLHMTSLHSGPNRQGHRIWCPSPCPLPDICLPSPFPPPQQPAVLPFSLKNIHKQEVTKGHVFHRASWGSFIMQATLRQSCACKLSYNVLSSSHLRAANQSLR